MSRIEQRPDGSYVRRLTYLEEQLIQRLYREIEERKTGELAFTARLEEAINELTVVTQELSNLKNRFDAMQQQS